MPSSPCPQRDVLNDYCRGNLPAAVLDEVESHVSDCEACQEEVTRLDGASETLIAALRQRQAANANSAGLSGDLDAGRKLVQAIFTTPLAATAAFDHDNGIVEPAALRTAPTHDGQWPPGVPPSTVADFWRCAAASGLFSAEEIAHRSTGFADDQSSCPEVHAVVRQLVESGRLTPYQAKALMCGRADSLLLGDRELLEPIGQGGMGRVYKVRQRSLDRIEAVKVLTPELLESPASVARFEREAKAAARVTHPNLVTIFDAGREADVHFLAMELIEGCDLARVVKDHGPLPVDQAVGCIVQAAAGLQAAHDAGIIHRDVKPHNLLLDRRGRVKVLDLGLARINDENVQKAAQCELTTSGQIMGTLDYLSPEQALDTHGADARSDIYSLGCTLYFLLTGRPPYEGDSPARKLFAHRDAPIPSARDLRPEIPAELDAILQGKLLAKSPSDRCATMSEVAELLTSAVRPATPLAPSLPASTAASLDAFLSSPADTQAFPRFKKELPPVSTSSPTLARPQPAPARVSRRPLMLAAGLASLLLLGAITLLFRTPQGDIEVVLDEDVADDVKIEILQGGKVLEVIDAKKQWQITLNEGKYSVQVGSNDDKLQIDKKTVTITRHDKQIVRVTRIPQQREPLAPDVKSPPVDIQRGLVAELFTGTEFKIPVKKRVDSRIAFYWGQGAPDDEVNGDNFSIRWNGWIKAPFPGRYRLHLFFDDIARLWLDDKLVIDREKGVREEYVELDTAPHALKIEFIEGGGWAYNVFTWLPPGDYTEQVVPAEVLFQDRASALAANVDVRVLRPTPAAPPSKLKVGQAIDLLAAIDAERHAVAGRWWFDGPDLICDSSSGTRLQIPFVPPAEYELNMVVERLGFDHMVSIGLVAGGRQFNLWVGQGHAGIECLDGLHWNANELMKTGEFLAPHASSTLKCTIRKNRLTLTCDGKTVLDWEADFRRCSLRDIWACPSRRHLCLTSWENPSRISKLELTPLTTEPQPVPDLVPPSAQIVLDAPKDIPLDEWTDLLPYVDIAKDKESLFGDWDFERDGLATRSREGQQLILPIAITGEYDLRFEFTRHTGSDSVSFILPVGFHHCCFVLSGWHGAGSGFYNVVGVDELEPTSAVRPGTLTNGRRYRLEFTVRTKNEDVEINVTIDGKPFTSWRGKQATLAPNMNSRPPDPKRLTIGTHEISATFHEAKLRVQSGNAYLLATDRVDKEPFRLVPPIGNRGGSRFVSVSPDNAPVIGIRYSADGSRLYKVEPLFHRPTTNKDDAEASKKLPTLLAKDGYAVAGFEVKQDNGFTGSGIGGLRVVFMRLRGERLDPQDRYESPWIGPRATCDAILGCTGDRVVGLHGSAGSWLDSIGIILAKTPSIPTPPRSETSVSLTQLHPLRFRGHDRPYVQRSAVDGWSLPPQNQPHLPRDFRFCDEYISTPAPSRIAYAVPPRAKSFTAVGYCVRVRATYEVVVDGKSLFRSEPAGIVPIRVNLPADSQKIELATVGAGQGDNSYWLFPRFHESVANETLPLDGTASHVKCLSLRPLTKRVLYDTFRENDFIANTRPVHLTAEEPCHELIFAHAPSLLSYAIPEGTTEFSAVGYNTTSGTTRFRVFVDDEPAFTSPVAGIVPIRIAISPGAKKLDLVVDPCVDGGVADWSMWCYPRFHLAPKKAPAASSLGKSLSNTRWQMRGSKEPFQFHEDGRVSGFVGRWLIGRWKVVGDPVIHVDWEDGRTWTVVLRPDRAAGIAINNQGESVVINSEGVRPVPPSAAQVAESIARIKNFLPHSIWDYDDLQHFVELHADKAIGWGGQVGRWKVTDEGFLEAAWDSGVSWNAVVDANFTRLVVATSDPLGAVLTLSRRQPSSSLVRFPLHTANIRNVALSSDGRLLATASMDRSAALWDFQSGRLLQKFAGHGDGVRGVAISPDKKFVATVAGHDLTVRLWDAATGQVVRTFTGHTGHPVSVRFTPDGQRLMVGTDAPDATVRVWNVSTGETVAILPHTNNVGRIDITPDGKRAVTGCADRVVRVWDLATWKLLKKLGGHTEQAYSAAISPNGKLVVSGDDGGSIRFWDVESGKQIGEPVDHSGFVFDLAFAPDGTLVASTGDDGVVRFWEIVAARREPSGESSSNLPPPGGLRRSADLATAKSRGILEPNQGGLLRIQFTPDGKQIVVGGAANAESWPVPAYVRQGDTGVPTRERRVATLRGHGGHITGLAFSRDGRWLASAGNSDRTARLWNVADWSERHLLRGHGNEYVDAVAFSPDGKSLFTAGHDDSVKVWDVATGKVNATFAGHGKAFSVSCSPRGDFVVTTGLDGKVALWDAEKREERWRVDPLKGTAVPSVWLWHVAIAPDGNRLAVGGDNCAVKVLDRETGAVVWTHRGDESAIRTGLAYSPDGKLLAFAGRDITICDAANGQAIRRLAGFESVNSLAFSPDGQQLVSGCADGTVRLWNVADGAPAGVLRGHDAAVFAVAFSQDGRHLATAGSGDPCVIHVWDWPTLRPTLLRENLTTDERPKQVRSVAADTLAPGEWYDLLSTVDVDQHVIDGIAERTADGLRLIHARAVHGSAPRFVPPVRLEGSYELEFSFTRVAGDGELHLVFPNGKGRRSSLVLSGWGGGASGLATIDGKYSDDGTRTEAVVRPGRLENGKRYTGRMRVDVDGEQVAIVVHLNGKPFLWWVGDRSRLGCWVSEPLPRSDVIGLGTWNGLYTIHSLNVRSRSEPMRRWRPEVNLTSASPPDAIKDECVAWNGHWYWISDRRMNRPAANDLAEQLGGRLLEIGLESEHRFVTRQFPNLEMWLGAWRSGKDVNPRTYWLNDRLQPLNYFGPWGLNEPSAGDVEMYLSLFTYGPGEWHDHSLDASLFTCVEWGDEATQPRGDVPVATVERKSPPEFTLKTNGLGGVDAVRPMWWPKDWVEPGQFAHTKSLGGVWFPQVKGFAYAVELELTFKSGRGVLSLCVGDVNDANVFVPFDVDGRAFASVFNWLNEGRWRWGQVAIGEYGEKISLTLLVNESLYSLLRDGKEILRGHGMPSDPLLRIVNEWGNVDAVIHRCEFRPLTVEDWGRTTWKTPARKLEFDAARSQARWAKQNADLPPAPENQKPFVVATTGTPCVWIEPGTFGRGKVDNAFPAGRKTHITRGFWIGKYEVTQGEWAKLMPNNPSRITGSPFLPVDCVTWDDAIKFCSTLTAQERAAGRLPEGCEYRLPTDAEWEYACRAGTTGDTAVPTKDFWWYDTAGWRSHEAGESQPNAWGLHDMHGNVPEWCLDRFDSPWHDPVEQTDPFYPPRVVREKRAVRSGSWSWWGPHAFESWDRHGHYSVTGGYRGFRVVLGPVLTDKISPTALDPFATIAPQRLPLLPDALAVPPAGTKLEIGKWYDLLATIDVDQHSLNGRWLRKDRELWSRRGAPASRVVPPVVIHGDYELAFRVVPLTTVRAIHASIPVGPDVLGSVELAAWDNRVSGITRIKGVYTVDRPLRSPDAKAHRLDVGRAYDVHVIVTTQGDVASIETKLDGERLFAWSGPRADLGESPFWVSPRRDLLAVGVWDMSMRLYDMRIKMLTGDAERLSPRTPSAAAEPPAEIANECVKWNGRSYWKSPVLGDLAVAMKQAAKYRGRLLTISSAEEDAFVARTWPDTDIWLAGWRRGHDPNPKTGWVDQDLRPLRYIGAWGRDQPQGHEHALGVWREGGWGDFPEGNVLYAVLEWGAEPESVAPR